MTRNNKGKLNIVHIFVFLEVILYLSFLYHDITRANIGISNVLKYLSILICFFFLILPLHRIYDPRNISKYDQTDIILLRLALIFTLVSDYFLLFTRDYIYGLITFSFVQIFYLIRIYRWRYLGLDSFSPYNNDEYKTNMIFKESKKNSKKLDNIKAPLYLYFMRNIMLTVLILSIVLLTILKLLHQDIVSEIKLIIGSNIEIKLTIVFASFYFISLLLNLIDSFKVAINTGSMQTKIFCLGLFLFVLCDINVGIFNITNYMTVYNSNYNMINTISSISIWLFYLPSQVLISLSKYNIRQN